MIPRLVWIVPLAIAWLLGPGSPALGEDDTPSGEDAGASGADPGVAAPIRGDRVLVKLRTGATFAGVAKGPRCEVLRGRAYAAVADRDVPEAGIRIHYALGLNGFLFVLYRDIVEIEFGAALSENEGARLARDLAENRVRAIEVRALAREELDQRKARRRAERLAREGAREEGAEAEADAERASKIKDLLARFPPEQWKPDRLDQLRRRALILDVLPSEEERAFLSNYDLWLEGYMAWAEASGEDGRSVE